MLTEERQRLILDELDRTGVVRLRDLMAQLDASESTLRRDLSDLANAGHLQRVHGGAQKISTLRTEVGVREKATAHTAAKSAIARAAANLLQPGDLIFLDAGTTTAALIPLLKDKDITVITSGVDNASLLADYGVQTLMLGGTLKPLTKAVIGAVAAQALARYRFDWAFVGANGVAVTAGVTTPDPEEAATKRMALGQAAHGVILADASKFNATSFAQIAPLATYSLITAGAPLPPEFATFSNIQEASI